METTRRGFLGGLAAVGAYFTARRAGLGDAAAATAVRTGVDPAILAQARRRVERDQWNLAMGQVLAERGRLDEEMADTLREIEERWATAWRTQV